MEFFSGMIVGGVLTAALYCGWKFYNRTEEKDKLLAAINNMEFEERIRLVEKIKK